MRSVKKAYFLSVSAGVLLVACGQNAHVTQPDPAQIGPGPMAKAQDNTTPTSTPPTQGGAGGVTRPTLNFKPQQQISPVAPPPVGEGCMKHFIGRFPIRSITLAECKSMELPYYTTQERTYGGKTVYVHNSAPKTGIHSRCDGGCSSVAVKDSVQLIFSADITQLPPRASVTRINRLGLELQATRAWDRIDQTELFCLLDERICSGGKALRGLNPDFWASATPSRAQDLNRYFLEQLGDESLWQKTRSGQGVGTSELFVDFEEVIRGSGYELESLLYAGGQARTFRMVIADDMSACSGDVLVDLNFDSCAAERLSEGGSL